MKFVALLIKTLCTLLRTVAYGSNVKVAPNTVVFWFPYLVYLEAKQ